MVIGHSSSIFTKACHILCEYLVFREFRRNLYITLAKYLEQEGICIANLLLQVVYTQSSQVLK